MSLLLSKDVENIPKTLVHSSMVLLHSFCTFVNWTSGMGISLPTMSQVLYWTEIWWLGGGGRGDSFGFVEVIVKFLKAVWDDSTSVTWRTLLLEEDARRNTPRPPPPHPTLPTHTHYCTITSSRNRLQRQDFMFMPHPHPHPAIQMLQLKSRFKWYYCIISVCDQQTRKLTKSLKSSFFPILTSALNFRKPSSSVFTFLKALRCCQVIGWLDIWVNML